MAAPPRPRYDRLPLSKARTTLGESPPAPPPHDHALMDSVTRRASRTRLTMVKAYGRGRSYRPAPSLPRRDIRHSDSAGSHRSRPSPAPDHGRTGGRLALSASPVLVAVGRGGRPRPPVSGRRARLVADEPVVDPLVDALVPGGEVSGRRFREGRGATRHRPVADRPLDQEVVLQVRLDDGGVVFPACS